MIRAYFPPGGGSGNRNCHGFKDTNNLVQYRWDVPAMAMWVFG